MRSSARFWILCAIIATHFIEQSKGFVNFKVKQGVRHGLVHPYEVHIFPTHDVIAVMLRKLVNQDKCILRTPDFIDVDLGESNNTQRFEKWGSTGCGVKIKNVTKNDQGRWQLIAKRGDYFLQGVFTVIIQDESVLYQEGEFDYVEGTPLTNITFLKPHSQYCVMGHERGADMVVNGDCVYPLYLGVVQRKIQGKYRIGVGIAGSIEEIPLQKEVTVRVEDLDIGFVEESSSMIHVFCNLKNSLKRLEFCRFERLNDRRAFNLNDGVGKGRYSYYGQGMYTNECGMTILNPSQEDYSSWRCSVGVLRTSDNETSVMQGAMLVQKNLPSRTLDYSLYKSNINSQNEKRTIISEEFMPLTVSCMAPASLIYCSLQHPDGRIIAPNSTNETYTFHTQNLNIGLCELTLKEGLQRDNGDWTCYMGTKSVGLEMTEVVSVRVTGAIAAIEPEIYANQGDNVTIHCVTAGGPEELNYCRFITPNGTAFGIDDSITEKNAIGGEFFFPSISQTYLGDCSVTIKSFSSWHFGEWKCMGMLKTADIEYMDTIVIMPISDANIFSMASVTGIVVGVGVLVIIVGVIMWKRGAFPRMRLLGRSDTTREMEEPVQARFSGESGESVVRLNVGQAPSAVVPPPQRYGGTISSTQT